MLKLKNYMEEIVFNLLDDVIKHVGACKCEECRLDIIAKAMNNLPPQYFVVKEGDQFTKITTLQLVFEVQVNSALTEAAILVKSNPRHNVTKQQAD